MKLSEEIDTLGPVAGPVMKAQWAKQARKLEDRIAELERVLAKQARALENSRAQERQGSMLKGMGSR